MKKNILIISALTLMLCQACQTELKNSLDRLDVRISAMEAECNSQNANLAAYSAILKALNDNEHITGITNLGTEGYKINLSKSGSITIKNGKAGTAPRIAPFLEKDGKYYWGIQYSSSVSWMLDQHGNKVLATSVTPTLKIEDKKWYISYDNGKNYTYLGVSDGEDGEPLIESVVASKDGMSVIFTLADGTSFSLITTESYESFLDSMVETRDNIAALYHLASDLTHKPLYVKSVTDLIKSGRIVGKNVALSNGDIISIMDWTNPTLPIVSIESDPDDHNFYWAITYYGKETEWILDDNGNKVKAAGAWDAVPPIKPVEYNGNYYWAIVEGGNTSFITANDGSLVESGLNIFSAIDNSNDDYLILTLCGGKEIKIQKEHTMSLESSAITMAPGAYVNIGYTLYGLGDETEIRLIVQGELSAYASVPTDGYGVISISALQRFEGNGKVVVMASAPNGSTIVKSVTISALE